MAKKTHTPPDAPGADGALPSTTEALWQAHTQEVEALRAKMDELIRQGATAPGATLAQKFEAGDLVLALEDLVRRTTKSAPSSDVKPASQDGNVREQSKLLLNRFMSQPTGAVSREVFKTYGRMAQIWPPGDPMRGGGLSYSHLRLLSQGKAAARLPELLERTLRENLSTGDLQRLIRGEAGLAQCAYSDVAITNSDKSIELHVNPAALKPGAVVPALGTPPRGAASRKKSPESKQNQGSGHRVLRFADMHALLAWISANIDRFA